MESGEVVVDSVRQNSIALREIRQRTSSKSDEVVIENDEDEVITTNESLLKIVVNASPTKNASVFRTGVLINPVTTSLSNSTDRQHTKCLDEVVTFSEQPNQEPKRGMLRIKEAVI